MPTKKINIFNKIIQSDHFFHKKLIYVERSFTFYTRIITKAHRSTVFHIYNLYIFTWKEGELSLLNTEDNDSVIKKYSNPMKNVQ